LIKPDVSELYEKVLRKEISEEEYKEILILSGIYKVDGG